MFVVGEALQDLRWRMSVSGDRDPNGGNPISGQLVKPSEWGVERSGFEDTSVAGQLLRT